MSKNSLELTTEIVVAMIGAKLISQPNRSLTTEQSAADVATAFRKVYEAVSNPSGNLAQH